MSLDAARSDLTYKLLGTETLDLTGKNKSDVIEATWAWYHAYKRWEENDTFLDAFTEKRLCITQRPDTDKVYQMEAKRTVAEEKEKYPGITYSVGAPSLAKRMNPDNYDGVNAQNIKHKYAQGLFDLSASLLNPTYLTIKGQLRWPFDGQNAKWPVVFIPLPAPDDVSLYNVLKIRGEQTKDQELQALIKFIRRRMTRPKLADAADMGAGPYDVAAKGQPAKIKYGWKSNNGVLTQKTIDRSITAATDYQQIIANAKAYTSNAKKVVASNELTIALRQRLGDRFPVITQYDPSKDRFVLLGTSRFFPEGFIPDKWQTTQEKRI
jgi:hypothetical protein